MKSLVHKSKQILQDSKVSIKHLTLSLNVLFYTHMYWCYSQQNPFVIESNQLMEVNFCSMCVEQEIKMA